MHINDICNRIDFELLEMYQKLMYSNFDYYDYKGNCSFPSFHFIRNIGKVIGKSSKSSRTDLF